MSEFSRRELKVRMRSLGTCIGRYGPCRLLLVCFEGLGSDSHRVFSRFVRGSREISSVSSLYRESTDSLIGEVIWPS